MPGKVKVRVVAGRSLPVMDRSNDTTDGIKLIIINEYYNYCCIINESIQLL
jgi:hypothetical protein